MAETTPGPLIMVLQFVGFLAAFRDPGSLSPLTAGILGGLLATWVTFTPCFLWIFLGAPFVEKLRNNKAIAAALATITAAVVGVVLNLAIWFALNSLFQESFNINTLAGIINFSAPVLSSLKLPSFGLAVVAIVAVFRFKLGMFSTLSLTSGLGIGLYFMGVITA